MIPPAASRAGDGADLILPPGHDTGAGCADRLGMRHAARDFEHLAEEPIADVLIRGRELLRYSRVALRSVNLPNDPFQEKDHAKDHAFGLLDPGSQCRNGAAHQSAANLRQPYCDLIG